MTSLYVDHAMPDDERRARLYAGDLFAYGPRPAGLALCELARELLEKAFSGVDPRQAQHHYAVEEYAAILSKVKPEFIHHPRCKEVIPQLLAELGCDLQSTYFDIPRMRSSTSGGYLTTGIAYAFHPHRDTWYSAPMCQINWWLPIYEVKPENGMTFHLRYWSSPVKNGSARYNYQQWVQHSRFNAATFVGKDTREQPKPEEPVELDPQLRVVTPPGGVMMFSAAHLHSSVPNDTGETRYSIDFRTVHIGDVRSFTGAPNVDSACSGTAMCDYLRGSDCEHVPDELVERYMGRHPQVPLFPG